MKTSLILISASLILLCSTYTTCKAQETNSKFGIKGGVNLSNLYTKDSDNDKMLTGFNIGIFSNTPLSEHLAFQPELYYSTKGALVTYNNTFVDGTALFKLDYIELPLLFVFNLTDNFNIHAGPYAAYLISGKVKNDSNVNLFNFEDNIKVDDYNRFDAGVALGIGIDFSKVSLGARYNYGLTTIGKEKSFLGTTYTFPDAKNGVLSVYASISLH